MNLYDRNQKQRNFFNEKIDTYDNVHEQFMNTKKEITDNLDSNTSKVLDLGAGTGLELIRFFEVFPNAKVTAIDITENMLAELAKRDFADKVNIICGDFFEVDFGNDYDAVISTSALHHFKPEEKKILYKKVYDSLKENGLFINCDKVSMTADEEFHQFDELEHNIDAYKHIDTPLTVDHEISILEECGFKEIKTIDVDKENYKLIRAKK